ncbi:MAG: hypothetical protein QMD00_03180 [Hadesarchaea archaeon]|nr:hypothetical protein [Hadesarchaea archaeon]
MRKEKTRTQRIFISDCEGPISLNDNAFGFFYNRCRWHQSMKGPPSGGDGGLKAWTEVII